MYQICFTQGWNGNACNYSFSWKTNCIQRIFVKMNSWCKNKTIFIRIIFIFILLSIDQGHDRQQKFRHKSIFYEGSCLKCYKSSHIGTGSDLVQCSAEEDTCIISGQRKIKKILIFKWLPKEFTTKDITKRLLNIQKLTRISTTSLQIVDQNQNMFLQEVKTIRY